MNTCPCGSENDYTDCCGPVISGERPAATAEQLMRSRYTAYAKAETAYLRDSLPPDQRNDFDEKSTGDWARNSEWHKLQIIEAQSGGPDDIEGTVEFIATFSQNGITRNHHELAFFKKIDSVWYFQNGEMVPQKPVMRAAPKTGRNDPCPCGSGKKYKKCCAAI